MKPTGQTRTDKDPNDDHDDDLDDDLNGDREHLPGSLLRGASGSDVGLPERRAPGHNQSRRAQRRRGPAHPGGPQVPGAAGACAGARGRSHLRGSGPGHRREAPLLLRLDLLRHPGAGGLHAHGPQAASALQGAHPHLPGFRPVLPGGQDPRRARHHRQAAHGLPPRRRLPPDRLGSCLRGRLPGEHGGHRSGCCSGCRRRAAAGAGHHL